MDFLGVGLSADLPFALCDQWGKITNLAGPNGMVTMLSIATFAPKGKKKLHGCAKLR